MGKGKDTGNEIHCTDIKALKDNTMEAVDGFALQYISLPRMTMDCMVMDVGQLRDAMGLRATIEAGDPWPAAEQALLKHGFRWHMLGGQRVMFLKEREDFVSDDGWDTAEEVS